MKTVLEWVRRTLAAATLATLATCFAPPVLAQTSPPAPDNAQDIGKQLDAMKKEQEQLLEQARQQLAAMPRYSPAEMARDPEARAQEKRRQQLVKKLAVIEQRIKEENARPRTRYLSPNTLGPIHFPYYLAMCRKIEARGTEHFPQANGRKLYGQLRIALVVHHDGRLLQAHVVEGSGNPTLDRLAEEITRAAAPFGQFTPEMRKDADQIDIVTTFKFTHDTAQKAASSSSTSCGDDAALKANPQN